MTGNVDEGRIRMGKADFIAWQVFHAPNTQPAATGHRDVSPHLILICFRRRAVWRHGKPLQDAAVADEVDAAVDRSAHGDGGVRAGMLPRGAWQSSVEPQIHQRSGRHKTVTGIEPFHPALAGKLIPGVNVDAAMTEWNRVDSGSCSGCDPIQNPQFRRA